MDRRSWQSTPDQEQFRQTFDVSSYETAGRYASGPWSVADAIQFQENFSWPVRIIRARQKLSRITVRFIADGTLIEATPIVEDE